MRDNADAEVHAVGRIETETSLTNAQIEEARGTLELFENFNFGIVVVSKDDARLLAKASLSSVRTDVDIELFLQEVDFNDPASVEKFLRYWTDNKKLLDYLPEGNLDPERLREYGLEKYPVFLFINPHILDLFSTNYLGSEKASEKANGVLRWICKYGRINVAVTPDIFEHTGSLWEAVPEAYRKALVNPEDTRNKETLAEYLYHISGFKKLGFEGRVEHYGLVHVPTSEAVKRVVSS